MPLQIAPPPNFNVNVPQADPLANLFKIAQLKEMAGRQAMLPAQLELGQQQAQGAELENTKRQIELNSQKAMMDAIAGGAFNKYVGVETPDGSGFDAGKAYQDLITNYKVLPDHAAQAVGSFQAVAAKNAEIRKNLGEASTAYLKNRAEAHQQLAQDLANVMDSGDPATALSVMKTEYAKNPPVGIDANDLAIFQKSDVAHLPAVAQLLRLDTTMDTYHAQKAKTQAEATKAQQEADPVFKWISNPQALAEPGAESAIKAEIADESTKPEDKNRLQLLIPKAKVAQDAAIKFQERKDRAQQFVTQGGPEGAKALAQMLVSRAITVDEMKVRGLTPQFEAQVFGLAQQMDPTFKAPEAAAQGKIAAAPVNQQFFGNTDSLLIKGGTLDQVEKAAQAIPSGKIPVFNKVGDVIQALTGQGPISKYAASILGVADDYAKVMGGAIGTDSARQQILDLLKPAQSPEQIQGVVSQFRQQIVSQRRGRVGSNPYLKDMYPEPEGAERAAASSAVATKTYTQADVDAAVAAHPGLTAAQAEAAFKAKNWSKK